MIMSKGRTIAELERGMTPKQVKLARALAAGGISKGEAYRQVYGWNGSSKPAMHVEATRTAAHPKVSLLTTAIRDRETARLWENKSKFQNWLMEGITSTITNTDSDITRLKALELAGKTKYASLFEEPQANESTTNLHANICDMIQARLANLLAPDVTNMIDVTPTDLLGDGVSEAGDTQPPTGGGEGE